MKDKILDALPTIIVILAIVVTSCLGVWAFTSAQDKAAAQKEEERREIYEEAYQEGYMAAVNEYDDLLEEVNYDWFHDGYAVGYDEGYDDGVYYGRYTTHNTIDEVLRDASIETIIDYLIGAYDIELDEALAEYGYIRENSR